MVAAVTVSGSDIQSGTFNLIHINAHRWLIGGLYIAINNGQTSAIF